MSVVGSIIVAVFGLIGGSFIGALVFRLHEQSKLPKRANSKRLDKNKQQINKKQPTANDLSILKGRSICPHCYHQLAWDDLVPLFSWLWLKGRCRYCHRPISAQYPFIELATAGLFLWSYLAWPSRTSSLDWLELIIWLVILVGLIALLVYDLRWLLLPNKLVFPLIVIATGQVLISAVSRHDIGYAWSALQAAAIVGGLFYGLFAFSNGRWIGGGDVKLGFLLGLLVGSPLKGLTVIFVASVLGSLITAPLLINKKVKLKSRIPFGPFLIFGGIFIKLLGSGLIAWYKRKFLIS